MEQNLTTETRSLAKLVVNGDRYAVHLEVKLKPEDGKAGETVFIHDDTAIVINGAHVVDMDKLILWAAHSGQAEVIITKDERRYGCCVKLEFNDVA